MDLSSYVPQKQYRYYFERCDAMEQKVYDALLDGYLKQKKEIRVWVANSDSLWKIHQAICYDVPEVFFVKKVQASMFDCSKWKAPKRTIRKTGKQVEVFNIKEYVQEVKKKKMRELMGEDQSSSLEHPSPSLPVTSRGSMTGSDPKKDKQDEESGFDVDSLIAKIDAKIAALEAEEAAEKVAKNWEVILLAAGESKLAVIKAIREHTKMGLKQTKDIVDHLPHTFTFCSAKKAEQVVNAISDAGGIAISGIADCDEDDDE